MAMCYFCGPGVEGTHRRSVVTGRSSGAFVSRRSFGGSGRVYTGLRTVCARCAASIDEQSKRSQWVGAVMAACVMVFFLVCMTIDEHDKTAKATEIANTRLIARSHLQPANGTTFGWYVPAREAAP